MSGLAIDPEHERQGDRVAQVLSSAGFLVDREVDVEVAGSPPLRYNLDVCALYEDTLIVCEVKVRKKVPFKSIIADWKDELIQLGKHESVRVLHSRRGQIHTQDMRNLKTVAVRVLPTRTQPGSFHKAQARAAGLDFWSLDDMEYYRGTAKSLGHWTRYEIMYDMGLRTTESSTPIHIKAIESKQPGGKYYMCNLQPLQLLQIAYVYRRGDEDTSAYQRIIKHAKVESMSAFLKSRDAWLPNNIILAIDPKVAPRVKFDNGWLDLPGDYCSARIVDGQHRLYGFVGTKYETKGRYGRATETFDLPVVVYCGLNETKQTAMFVDINNNQKRIDATLLADLSTVLKDLRRKETWPSLVAKQLAASAPFQGQVKISQRPKRGRKKPVTLAGLSNYVLIRELLNPKFRKGVISRYDGALFAYAPFDWAKSVNGRKNREAMKKQVDLLINFFTAIKKSMGLKWMNGDKYGVTSHIGINSFLYVLNKMLIAGIDVSEANLPDYLAPIRRAKFSWTQERVLQYPTYPGFRQLANTMIRALNSGRSKKLDYYVARKPLR